MRLPPLLSTGLTGRAISARQTCRFWRRRPELMTGILGQDVRIVQPPLQLNSKEDRLLNKTQSFDLDNRRPAEGALVSEGVHREMEPHDTSEPIPLLHRMDE